MNLINKLRTVTLLRLYNIQKQSKNCAHAINIQQITTATLLWLYNSPYELRLLWSFNILKIATPLRYYLFYEQLATLQAESSLRAVAVGVVKCESG